MPATSFMLSNLAAAFLVAWLHVDCFGSGAAAIDDVA
jgi:hypothetical protein